MLSYAFVYTICVFMYNAATMTVKHYFSLSNKVLSFSAKCGSFFTAGVQSNEILYTHLKLYNFDDLIPYDLRIKHMS